MSGIWSVAKNSRIPMSVDLPTADDMPWTIAYVVRKRVQLDSYSELDEEKRPPDRMIWYGTPEEIDDWFKKVFKTKNHKPDQAVFEIDDDDIG